MADAVIGLLLDNLNSLIQREFALLWGVEDDVNRLSSSLSAIRAVLQDAESKQFIDKAIADWLRKLKDASYDAEDVLDDWPTDSLNSTTALSCLNPSNIKFSRHMAKNMKRVISRFDMIAEERSKFHLSTNIVQTGPQLDDSRETSSILTEEVVYGRDSDKENVVNVLLNNASSGEQVSVFSILGVGGLGKTTLAQLVFRDQRVVEHFNTRIWVFVSENFEVNRVTKMILQSAGSTCDMNALEPLQLELQKVLSGKKFLLVLDDLWNEDLDKWQRLMLLLQCGAKGSSIVITTRVETVTSVVGTPSPYRLTFLSEEESWSLFKRHAFGLENKENAKLIEIGKQIVSKCGGVPIAAKALGGMLFSKREIHDWLQVRDSEIWELPNAEVNGILPSLRLSYQYLPPHAKPCFAFCSIYPRGYRINKEELVYLWMANGFLQSDGRIDLEDVGNQVFNELLRRSFFQDIEEDRIGDVGTFMMHDLMHDLACSVSLNECCFLDLRKRDTIHKGIRHGSVAFDSSSTLVSSKLQLMFKSNMALRTLVLMGEDEESLVLSHISLRKLSCLRAIDLSETNTKVLPDWIGKMKHLRYLNLSGTMIRSLPESICNLRKLQALKLEDCKELEKLPEHMSKMSSLRHLDILGCGKINKMPAGMGQLIELRTLRVYAVGSESGRTIKELQRLNHLRGELYIDRLEQVRNPEEAKAANLFTKKNIHTLGLWWRSMMGDEAEANSVAESQEKVLEEGLQPHPSLKQLGIVGYKGAVMPSWMGQLQDLVLIELVDCERFEHLPSLGKLSHLKHLNINGMKNVKCIGNEFYGEVVRGESWFPSLEKFLVFGMSNLEEWLLPSTSSLSGEDEENPRGQALAAFPCLETLEICRCPKLKAIPCLPSVQRLFLSNCNEMILRSLENLSGLDDLEIDSFEDMVSIPEGTFINSCLTSLKYLQISGCDKLKSLPREIEGLTSLRSLWIKDCRELISLSKLEGILHKFTSLTYIRISGCSSIKSLPVLGIRDSFNNSFEYLIIDNCSNLTSLCEGWQYLTSLQNLYIEDCPKLELSRNEDFQHLMSLKYLQLSKLPQLKALPDWLQYLTALQHLVILDCHPDLHRRWEEYKDEDWHIISHIPNHDISRSIDSSDKPSTSVGRSSSSSSRLPVGILNKLMSRCFNNNNSRNN